MKNVLGWFLVVAIGVGCGGSGGESEATQPTSTDETGGEVATSSGGEIVARFQGTLAGALAMTIELDANGGGVITYPDNGRTQQITGCTASGPTLTCRVEAAGYAGDLEMTHRDDRSGVEGRMRSDSDGTWSDFSADTVAQ